MTKSCNSTISPNSSPNNDTSTSSNKNSSRSAIPTNNSSPNSTMSHYNAITLLKSSNTTPFVWSLPALIPFKHPHPFIPPMKSSNKESTSINKKYSPSNSNSQKWPKSWTIETLNCSKSINSFTISNNNKHPSSTKTKNCYSKTSRSRKINMIWPKQWMRTIPNCKSSPLKLTKPKLISLKAPKKIAKKSWNSKRLSINSGIHGSEHRTSLPIKKSIKNIRKAVKYNN